MPEVFAKVANAAAAVEDRWPLKPKVALVLGSGHGAVAELLDAPVHLPFAEVPYLPKATATGHRGQLVGGTLSGIPTLAMQGRVHVYEGHSAADVALPIRVLQALGADTLVLTNAAGGLNPQYSVGDLMVIDDHINLMFRNPLVGANDTRLGPRWPDMCEPYDPALCERTQAIARRQGIVCHRGVYVGMLGPTYETRAEYRMLRRLGGDAVGMSTVPEVIVARQLGMRVVGLSTITNVCSPDRLHATSGDEVIEAASGAAQRIATLLAGLVRELG